VTSGKHSPLRWHFRVAALACGACTGEEPTEPENCEIFGGDEGAPIEIVPGVRLDDGSFLPLAEGDTVDLIRPIQGGHVIFASARARNLCLDGVTLSAKLFDGDQIRVPLTAISQVGFLTDADDTAWSIPDMAVNTSNTPNLNACPNASDADIVGRSHRLEVKVDDMHDHAITVSVEVVPSCNQADVECQMLCDCECSDNGGTLGMCPAPKDIECETALGSSSG
jgi:hypothetical protein